MTFIQSGRNSKPVSLVCRPRAVPRAAGRVLFGLAALMLLATGCAALRAEAPTRIVNGVPIYERDEDTVDAYCKQHAKAEHQVELSMGRTAPLRGCWVSADRLIMVVPDNPAILAHELRHAQGWDHIGPCHSRNWAVGTGQPVDIKPDGVTPCEWYRR